ncbi:MAG TPA: hypothetical protein DCP91_07185 [Eggerthellaceae bacterium]|nr:hypothetical protein [Eggerthellaceae bacterium]
MTLIAVGSRFWREVVHGIAGAAVLDPAARAIVVALCMAVLSPVMAELGKHLDDADIDVPKGGGADAA